MKSTSKNICFFGTHHIVSHKNTIESQKMEDVENPHSSSSSKKRGKSQAKKDADAVKDYSCVNMKLNSVLAYPPFAEVIYSTVLNWTKMQQEGWLIANYHLQRCIRQDLPFPEFNQTFFGRCIIGSTDTKRKCADVELAVSIEEYRSLRTCQVPRNEQMNLLISNLAKQMVTSAKNSMKGKIMWGRVKRYLKLKYKVAGKWAYEFCREVFDERWHGCLMREQVEFKEWMKYDPRDFKAVEAEANYFLLKSTEILRFMETLPKDTKGVKKFALLPMKKGYTMSCLIMYESTLRSMLQLLPETNRRMLMKKALTWVSQDVEITRLLKVALGRKTANFSEEMFKIKLLVDTLWQLIFNVKKYETVNRKFANEIKTDGYTVSLTFQKPKSEDELRHKEEYERENPGNKWNSYAKKMCEDLDVEFDPMPLDCSVFDRIGGLDPGVTNLVEVCFGDENHPSNHVRISGREYRKMCKMNERRVWNKRLRKRDKKYAETIENLPCLKTANLDTLSKGIRHVLRKRDFLFECNMKYAFRKWRFKTYMEQQKALVRLARRLAPKGTKTLIGFGNWSQHDGVVKGHPKTPTKKFKRELRKVATVVEIDEYLTSQVCSECWGEEKTRNVEYYVDRKVWYARKKKKVIKEGMKWVECHQVIRCCNNDCMKCWQRDRNAARNIFKLLHCKIQNEERPLIFQRGKKKATKEEQEDEGLPVVREEDEESDDEEEEESSTKRLRIGDGKASVS